jgi:hypothetical protein
MPLQKSITGVRHALLRIPQQRALLVVLRIPQQRAPLVPCGSDRSQSMPQSMTQRMIPILTEPSKTHYYRIPN